MFRDYDKLKTEHGFTDEQIATLKAIDGEFTEQRNQLQRDYDRKLVDWQRDHAREVEHLFSEVEKGRIRSAAEAHDDG